MSAQIDTISSKSNMFEMFDVSTLANEVITLLTNSTSSTLFLVSVLLQVGMCSSMIRIKIIRGTWSDVSRQSGWIVWELISKELHCKNIRSMTEFELLASSEYLVGI